MKTRPIPTILTTVLLMLFVNVLSVAANQPAAERQQAIQQGSTFTVNSTGDAGDANPGNEICDTGAGVCTLRAALEEANDGNSGPYLPNVDHDIIRFGFGSSTVIRPNSALPTIWEPVTIDGISNSFASCPTASNPASLLITISGENAGNASGIDLGSEADGSVIYGLNIVNWLESGIRMEGFEAPAQVEFDDLINNVTIRCNHIGLGNANQAMGNGTGITVQGPYVRNITIGGDNVADRNVISGSTHLDPTEPSEGSGIQVVGGGEDEMHIRGNYIGTTKQGTAGLGNASMGIYFGGWSGSDDEIGSLNRPNTIAYNGRSGIMSSSGTKIHYNNIHNNGENGIVSFESSKPEMRFNNIYSNGLLGIDVGDNGVDGNTLLGTNNSPIIWSISGNNLEFSFTSSTFAQTYRFDVFFSPSCDPSGFGEGQTYQETFTVSNLFVYNTLQRTLSNSLPSGQFITLTATDTSTNTTSEFSNCVSDIKTFVVNNRTDLADANHGNGSCDDGFGSCTLRGAIQEMNALTGFSSFRIVFDLSGADTTILLSGSLGELPNIQKKVFMDGTTREGTACPTETSGGVQLIRVIGSNAGVNADGLFLDTGSDGSTIQGMTFEGFSSDGIVVGSDNNRLFCNEFGSGISGGPGNSNTGMLIIGDNNTVGGWEAWRRNVFAKNGNAGIQIFLGSGNDIHGNFIGTSSDGTMANPNADGVVINAGTGSNNNVGGDVLFTIGGGDRVVRGHNVISGNTGNGIEVINGVGVTLGGNYIGLQRDGVSPLGNGRHGIEINPFASGADGTIIGKTRAEDNSLHTDPNVIGNNGLSGIFSDGSNDVQILNNYIGLSEATFSDAGNSRVGISLTGDDGLIRDNVVGFNNRNGIEIYGSDHQLYGNWIGIVPSSSRSDNAANGESGIFVDAKQTQIGKEDDADSQNVIAHNEYAGVFVEKSAESTQIVNNLIHTNSTDGIVVIDPSINNNIYQNIFYGNKELPIDLDDDDELNENDDGDEDKGGNGLQNNAIIEEADADSGDIIFTFSGVADAQFYIEFYTDYSCERPSNGRYPIKRFTFFTDGDGRAEEQIGVGGFVGGSAVSAIVTSSHNNGNPASSSEFSECVRAEGVVPAAVELGVFETSQPFNQSGLMAALLFVTLVGVTQLVWRRSA